MHLLQRAQRRFLVPLTAALLIVGTLVQAPAATADTAGFYAWGRNSTWQLGDGTADDRTTPTAIPSPSLSAIAAGQVNTCGLVPTGTAYCWGDNFYGQLGIGNNDSQITPQPVLMPSGTSVATIAAGALATCALTTVGTVFCWGDNYYGQLGIGNNTNANSPQPVSAPSGVSFTAIAVGFAHACALTSTGTAYCWGYNSGGQLGIGNQANQNTPQAVTMPAGVTFSSINVGSMYTCAQTSNGAAYCWGSNVYGQLGIGNQTNQNTPQAVTRPAGVTFAHLVTGGNHACAISDSSALYCWGVNVYGQLGLGSNVDQSSPQLVPPSTTLGFTRLYGGLRHTCALTSAGTAYCWGYNADGQLGIGNTANANTPQALSASLRFAALAVGPLSLSSFALPFRLTAGRQVPTAPLQQFARAESDTCDRQPEDLVDFPALTELKNVRWLASWAQWPNGGTGGFVCTRQPYYTDNDTWGVR